MLSQENTIDEFFIASIESLRNLNFSEAEEHASLVKQKELRDLTTVLVSFVSKEIVNIPEIAEVSSEYELTNLLKHLNNGFAFQLSDERSILKSYQSFSKAIGISDKMGLDFLTKMCLFEVLSLIKSEIYIGSKQYLPYLEHLRELRADSLDDFKLLLLESVFFSKSNSEMKVDFNYFESIKKIDSIAALLPQDHPFLIYYFFEKGIENRLLENYFDSEFFFKKVDSLTNGKPYWAELYNTTLWQLAALKFDEKKYNQARKLLNKSRKVSETMRDTFFDDRLESWILEKQGKYDSAYYYLNRSLNIEYKMGAKNNSLETALLSVENQTEKLKLDNLISENRRKANRNWLIIASLALFLGTGIAILLQKNTTKKRQLAEQEALLKQQRVENLLKEQELVSIDAMIAGQEKERQKVAGELHDDLGSLMATIKLHFENAKVSKKDPALKNAQKLLEEAYQKIRGMAHSKNSGVMSDQGLLPAIKKMAHTITETDALEVTVEDFGLGERMENSLELSIFRMVQELVANTIKHAEASKVNIQLTQHDDNLNIIVEDNGKGFDRSKLKKNQAGMGLTNIEKRVEHLGGNFTVDSVLGKGTSILIDIPV